MLHLLAAIGTWLDSFRRPRRISTSSTGSEGQPTRPRLETLEGRLTPSSGASAVPPASIGSVFDPNTATWYIHDMNGPGAPTVQPFQYGLPGWVPLTGDWTGSGRQGIGVFDPGTATFYLRNEPSAGAPDAGVFQYGAPGWKPIVGNWSGRSGDGVGVFDPGTATFYLRNEASSGAPDAGVFQYGAPGWVPIAGHWYRSPVSGATGIGVYDPTTSTFYLRTTASAGIPDAGTFAFGQPGSIPVVGDWNHLQRVDVGVFDPNTASFDLRFFGVDQIQHTRFQYGGAGWDPIVTLTPVPPAPWG
jgi:hypothetical protein